MRNSFVRIIMVLLIIVFIFGVYSLGVLDGKRQTTFSTDSREHRRLELELSDMKSRLETLERINIQVDIKDKTNTWFVYDGKVE